MRYVNHKQRVLIDFLTVGIESAGSIHTAIKVSPGDTGDCCAKWKSIIESFILSWFSLPTLFPSGQGDS
jgi:hypothetical protein